MLGQRPGAIAGRRLPAWLLCFVCGLALFLAGCAQPPRASDGLAARGEAWSGRLALQVEGQASQSFSALFELRGNAQQGELALLSPLGTSLGQLAWKDGHAEWASGQDKRTSDSLDALLREATGTSLPVAALFHWLRGEQATAAGWQADVSAIDQGRLTARRDHPLPQATLRIALTR